MSNRGSPVPVPAGDLRLRLISAAVLAVLALAGAWVGGWPAAIVAALACLIVFREWALMTAAPDPTQLAGLVGGVSAAVVLSGVISPLSGIVAAVVVAAIAAGWTRSAWLVAGVAYASALGIGLLALRGDPVWGLEAIIFVFAVVWASDTGAYFAGRTIGGPKLWPRVSPKKTWSGLAGGIVAGVAAGLLAAVVMTVPVTPALGVVALSLSLVSVAGDLFESAVKRHFHAKDASGLIPGHGGLMDRVDGLIFAATAAALLGWLHGGAAAPGGGLLLW